MSDGEGSDDNNSVDLGPRPQQKLTMLFNLEDFEENVLKDKENLCAVVITSTLCPHSGIRKLKYPKVVMPRMMGERKGGNEYEEGSMEDEPEEDEPEEEEEDEEDEDDGREGGGRRKRSRFFEEMKAKLITTDAQLVQRRHVRFFHVCACTVNETNIQPLIAKDVAFNVTGRRPNKVETSELHRSAYEKLEKLLHTLDVKQTPCMLFFVRGLRLRYSLMPVGGETPASDYSVSNRMIRPSGEKDWIWACGSNIVKWKHLLHNAVVVRNEMLRSYDEEIRAKLKEERRLKRKEERLERRRQQQLEEAEEEEEDYEE